MKRTPPITVPASPPPRQYIPANPTLSPTHSTMMAAKEASKAAQRAKEEAVHAKKTAQRDAQLKLTERDTSKEDASAAGAAEAAKKRGEKAALEAAEGGASAVRGGAPVMKRCKDCKMEYNKNSKKGCENCTALLFGGGVAPKKGRGKK